MNTIHIYGNVTINTVTTKPTMELKAEHFNKKLREFIQTLKEQGANSDTLFMLRAVVVDVTDHIRTLEGQPRSFEQTIKDKSAS